MKPCKHCGKRAIPAEQYRDAGWRFCTSNCRFSYTDSVKQRVGAAMDRLPVDIDAVKLGNKFLAAAKRAGLSREAEYLTWTSIKREVRALCGGQDTEIDQLHRLLKSSGDSEATINAWLFGMNPLMGDQAPSKVWGQKGGPQRVLEAARAWLAGG